MVLDGEEWLDAEQLARRLGVSVRTARKRIADCVQMRTVQREGRTGTRQVSLVPRSAFPVDDTVSALERTGKPVMGKRGRTVPRSPGSQQTHTLDTKAPYWVEVEPAALVAALEARIADLQKALDRAEEEKAHLRRLLDQAQQSAREQNNTVRLAKLRVSV